MTYEIRDLGPLHAAYPSGGLFAGWLQQEPLTASATATAELQEFLKDAGPAGGAPLWQEQAFRELLPPALQDLAEGPDIVVTGQQPGLLGGPLLTLYKVATTVALARRRSEAGRPTVPVFWSGDDDDDLAEALAPVGWDLQRADLWRAPVRPVSHRDGGRHVLASFGPELWAQPVLTHLAANGGTGVFSRSIHDILSTAVAEHWDWGTGQAVLITRLFADAGLVVVRGNDSRLQAAAAPFYDQVAGRLPALSKLAGERGAELAAMGFHAQISDRSLARPIFKLAGRQRQTIGEFSGQDAADLRPGVMLRSLVQDWLLRPAAVVVGPGELAYLRQLDPLYEALALSRSPLVPRFSGWLLPQGVAFGPTADLVRPLPAERAPDVEALADRIGETVRQKVAEALVHDLHVDAARADDLAAGRTRRFRKGVVAMLAGERERVNAARLAGAPAWVFPDGQRQERALGFLSALSLWRGELLGAIMTAAEGHLARGAVGDWREWALLVPTGEVES